MSDRAGALRRIRLVRGGLIHDRLQPERVETGGQEHRGQCGGDPHNLSPAARCQHGARNQEARERHRDEERVGRMNEGKRE